MVIGTVIIMGTVSGTGTTIGTETVRNGNEIGNGQELEREREREWYGIVTGTRTLSERERKNYSNQIFNLFKFKKKISFK